MKTFTHFHRALALLLALATAFSGPAATLTGTILKSNGQPYASSTVRFRATSTPVLLSSGELGTGGDYDYTTTAAGALTNCVLIAGIYRVFIGSDKNFLIDVPDDDDTYTISSRITNSLATWQTTIPATIAVPLASSATAGKVKTNGDDADPVVYLVDEVDALIAALNVSGKLNATNGTSVGLTLSGTTTIPSGSTLTLAAGAGIKGDLYAINNDLTDLASNDPAQAGISHSQKVLYDGDYPFNRLYQWDATSTDDPDTDAAHIYGVRIVIPSVEPWESTPATAGRWIMLQ